MRWNKNEVSQLSLSSPDTVQIMWPRLPRFPTYVVLIHQRHRQTARRTTCSRKTALCTIKGVCIMYSCLWKFISQLYGVSLAVWDHTVLPATRHKGTHPAFTPARQAGIRFTDHLRMEGWVSPGPGCKEQLAYGCYATAWASETRTHDISIASRAR